MEDNKNSLVGVKFFNEESFDKAYYINLLKTRAQEATPDAENEKILEEVIKSIEEDEFVLNSQERSFIKRNPQNTLEYVIYRYKFRIYPEKSILTDFPVYILIEPTSICNLRCKMCFQTDDYFSQKENMGFIDLDFYKSLIDQAVEGKSKALTMASRGEPLLNKNFDKMLEYAGGKFFELKVNTNCMLLDENKAHMLLDSDITDLVFSIDSADKRQYENLRVGADFDKITQNIKQFNKIREKHYPNSNLVTRISGVKCSEEQDMDRFVKHWAGQVDSIAYVNCINRKDSYNNEISKARYRCKTLWNRMYIWWDGTCNPCDFDYKSNLKLGNAKEKSLKEIWNGSKMQELRLSHSKGERAKHHPCDVCEL